MALPSGYSKIDYIEATGTQYINTGFKPNGNSRIVMDCEPTNLSSTFCFFCARTEINANDTTANVAFYLGRKYRKDFYGESQSTTAAYTAGTRFTIDSNKNEVAFGADYTLTFTASSKVSPMPLILMASAVPGDTDGTFKSPANYAKMKLYGAKIYDNGTLVRDFVPCKNASGTLGLWDNVNSVFYANAGTGTFSTGTKHKTLIDGVGYEIKSGRVLIAGTGYDIKKGRTLIGGTGYDISFGTPVGELAVGSSVYMNVGGVRKEWLVVHQGNLTPAYYDDTCNGTWLLLKDIYTLIEFAYETDAEAGGYRYHYEYSKVDNYLRNTFFPLLEPHIQSLIKQINLPLISRGSATYDTPVTVPRKIFCLDRADLGFGHWSGETDVPLSYFSGSTPTSAEKKIGYYNGQATSWYTRDDFSSDLAIVHASGHLAYLPSVTGEEEGVRPSLVLPSDDAKFDDNFNIF